MARISIPRKVWIGPYEFSLQLVEEDDPILEPTDHEKTTGITHFDPPERGIYVCADLGRREMLETFLHELTHAVNFAGSIDDGVDEETIARRHGEIWSQLWLDNPGLQRWLTSTLNTIRRERSNV